MHKVALHDAEAADLLPVALAWLPQPIVIVLKAAAFAVRLHLQDRIPVHAVPEGGEGAVGEGGPAHGLHLAVAYSAQDEDAADAEAVEGKEEAAAEDGRQDAQDGRDDHEDTEDDASDFQAHGVQHGHVRGDQQVDGDDADGQAAAEKDKLQEDDNLPKGLQRQHLLIYLSYGG